MDRLRKLAGLQEQKAPKIDKPRVNYRAKEFDTGKCGICRYFLPEGACSVVAGDIDPEFTCDAVNMTDKSAVRYKVKPEDAEAFAKGMVKEQPFEHNVLRGFNSPVGYLLIIQDTMKPKPHIFSISFDFSVEHTSREHYWTQEEVDRLIKSGKK